MNWRKAVYSLFHWETWHYHVKYIPLYPIWAWYCLRAGSLWFFTPSNPTIEFGGFEGEDKKHIYGQLPPGTYPDSAYIPPSLPFSEVLNVFKQMNFTFPVAVKPDVGMMGFMFRKIDNADELHRYHDAMPSNYIIQELIHYPIEVSIFYYRFPDKSTGTITGFIKKEPLHVVGDGQSSLWQLILDHPRARFRLAELHSKHAEHVEKIIPEGQVFNLSWAANLSRGARLISLEHEKDVKLLNVIDKISNYTKHFYYGRYDIKCASVEDLKEGKNFSILEYNGSGAEPHHIYGNGNTLLQAYKIVMHHWKVLYRISKYNHQQGVPYYTYREGLSCLLKAKKHFKMLKKLDAEFSIPA